MQAPLNRWLALPLLAVSVPALADASFRDLFEQGKPVLDLRYRHESVSQDNALRDAGAHTLRTRLGFQSGRWHGFSGLLEIDNVSHLGGDGFNDTRNGRTTHAVVADPDGTEINQASLRFDGARGSAILGRQRINLDNQRFVGGVAWRQNEQTYDGASLQFKPREGTSVGYAWLDNVNTVFGPADGARANAANRADIDGDSHLFNLRHAFSPALAVTAYHYRLDLENVAVAATAPLGTLSSRTSGVRADGARGAFGYALEYARQRDLAGNPWTLDSEYSLAELGYRVRGVQLKLGQETLGAGPAGPGNRAFQTPLATKHLFQGWADVFLTTPADGLVDRYVGAIMPLAGGTAQAWYHDFSADRGGGYGREFDLSYAHPIPGVKGLSALVKYARYDSDDRARSVDTEKFWLQLQYSR